MKFTRIVTVVLLALSVLSLSVFAAVTPSVAEKAAPEIVFNFVEETGEPAAAVIEAEDGTKTYVSLNAVTVVSKAQTAEAAPEVAAKIEAAVKDFTEKKDWNEVVENFEELFTEATDGAPVENAIVTDIFDVDIALDIPDGACFTFTVKVDGIKASDKVLVLHKPDSTGKWQKEQAVVNSDGTVTITAKNGNSPFAIIVDNGEPPVEVYEAPQTGVNEIVMPAMLGVVLFIGCAVFFALKLRRRAEA